MSYAANFGVVRQAVQAGPGARLAATLIDAALLWFSTGAGLSAMIALCARDGIEIANLTAFGWMLRPLAALLYYAAFEAGIGATPGKVVMLLCVRRRDGSPIGLGAALWRNLAKLASVLPFGAGCMLSLWMPRGEALHDIMAGSVVVRADA